jgi:hypothetical protein
LLALPAGMLVERLGPIRMMPAGIGLVLAGTLGTVTAHHPSAWGKTPASAAARISATSR